MSTEPSTSDSPNVPPLPPEFADTGSPPPVPDFVPSPEAPPPKPQRSHKATGGKRGRPKGSGGSGKPNVPPGPSAPPPPFAGPVADDTAPNVPPEVETARAAAKTLAKLDPAKASKQLVTVVDSILAAVAASRYGALIDPNTGKSIAQTLAVTQEERDELIDAVTLVLASSSLAMSPGVNLLVCAGTIYGVRGFMLETTLRGARKAAAQQQPAA